MSLCDRCLHYDVCGEEGCREEASKMCADFLGWIPVSKRLPENSDSVNITWVNHRPDIFYADIKDEPFTATGRYCNGQWWWDSVVCGDYLDEYGRSDCDAMDEYIEVRAWMPIPEPYKNKNSNFKAHKLPASYGFAFRKYYGTSARAFKDKFEISVSEAIKISRGDTDA